MNVDVLNDSLFIDDENRALSVPFMAQNIVALGDRPVRPEITQQRIRDPAQAFTPGVQAGNVVDADAQDLGI